MSQTSSQLILEPSVHRRSVVGNALITEVILVNLASVGPGEYITPMHLHPFHQIDVVLDGWVEHTIEGWDEPVRLTPGEGIVVPPLVRHGLFATDGFRHGSFKVFLVSRAARALGDGPFRFTASPTLCDTLEDVARRCKQDCALADDVIVVAGSLCIVEAADQSPSPSAGPVDGRDFRRTILPVLERVAEAPFGGWTVADLARECSMSVDHFSKCFRNVLGQTPQTFILETRLRNAAVDLLAEPPMTIEQVADRAGYSSRHTFTRAFSTYFKISPDAYRRGTRQSSAVSRLVHH